MFNYRILRNQVSLRYLRWYGPHQFPFSVSVDTRAFVTDNTYCKMLENGSVTSVHQIEIMEIVTVTPNASGVGFDVVIAARFPTPDHVGHCLLTNMKELKNDK